MKSGHQNEDLEIRTNSSVLSNKWAVPAAITFLAAYVYTIGSGIQDNLEREKKIRDNLAPNALNYSHRSTGPLRPKIGIFNEDVNGDGTYESVCVFRETSTGVSVKRIIEFDDQGHLKMRKFRVVDGKIKYLDK